MQLVEKYGAASVLGRQLYAREILRGLAAERVVSVKRQNMNSDNWAEWARKNPHEAELLAEVEMIIAEDEHA